MGWRRRPKKGSLALWRSALLWGFSCLVPLLKKWNTQGLRLTLNARSLVCRERAYMCRDWPRYVGLTIVGSIGELRIVLELPVCLRFSRKHIGGSFIYRKLVTTFKIYCSF